MEFVPSLGQWASLQLQTAKPIPLKTQLSVWQVLFAFLRGTALICIMKYIIGHAFIEYNANSTFMSFVIKNVLS